MGERKSAQDKDELDRMVVTLTLGDLKAAMRQVLEERATVANDVEQLMDHDHAAAALGVSPNALHKRVHRGLIEPDVRGGRDGAKGNRYSQATLDEYRRRKTPSPKRKKP